MVSSSRVNPPRVACPKCGSYDTYIYHQGNHHPKGLTFTCNCCALVRYKEAVVALIEAEEKRLEEIEKAEQKRKWEEVKRKKEEADRLAAEKEAWLTSRCLWHECEEEKRVNSIYCSRNCSNKNARARHRARVKHSVEA